MQKCFCRNGFMWWLWCLTPLSTILLMLWARIPLTRGVIDTALCGKIYQWLAAGRWFSPGTPISSTNKIDLRDITEVLLKVALNTIMTPWTHIMLYRLHLAWVGFELTTLVVIGTDCIDSCKSKCHTITTTTTPSIYCTCTIGLSWPYLMH
jgi:hypothetical protein